MARKKSEPVPAQAMVKDHGDHERRYRTQDALRTLTRAEEIRKDKALMRDVKKEAGIISRVVGRKAK